MDRIRDSRRGGVSVGGGPPPPRRRLRSNGGGSGGGGPRGSPRSERCCGERFMLNGGGAGGCRDDGDDTSDESLGDDDDDAEEELAPRYQPSHRRSPSTAPPPPSPPQPSGGHHHSSSSSGGGGGGGYNHHHHHGQQQQMQRKGASNPKSPIVLKAADEMIGVPVPRKARSASTKRSSHEWPVPGGGTSGGSAVAVDGSQIQRPSSRPISPASASTTAPARKKLKTPGGLGSSGGSGPAPKQRPSPSSAPSAAPPQPPPQKITKSPSFIQEEIEVAEVLFGLTRQFPCPPKQESNHKLDLRDAPEAKSGNSSPVPLSSGVRPSDSSSLATIAPKRKRPRLVKYDEDNRPSSPAKPELAEPSSRHEAPVARSEAKASTSVVAESGTSTAPAAAHLEALREPEKTDDRSRSRDSDLRASESDRRDHRPDSRTEPPPPSGKPEGEATPAGSEARSGEAIATTKIELAPDGARQEKFCIDLMAPPPGKLSPDRDGASDPDADKKGLDSEFDMMGRGNSEKKVGERTRGGLEIDLEDQKVRRILTEPKKPTLQLDLEKPSLGDEKLPSERRQQQPSQLHHQKPSKSEIKHEKSSMPAVTPPMPIPVGGWMGSFPPFGYLSPVPGLSAAGLHHPMDVKPGSSSGLQHAALLPPTRSKRCATHCYVAQLIQYHQRVAKMNSFWPPAAAAVAAAAVNRSGPFFGPRPFNMGVVPPTDAASLLVNPMHGSYPVRSHTPMQEAKAPSMATSPFQGSLSKDKPSLGSAPGAESSQRKHLPAHETQQSNPPMANMLQGPAFIFPFNQQHAAAVAAASAANRLGETKSSGASNVMPPSANPHASAANPGAAAMNLSFANLQPADAQFLAILQNGGAYPFQVAAHAGGPPSYRGMAPPGPAVPFFNGHVYSSHMLHPSQQQGAQQQNLQKTNMPSLSSSSQKHQPQQSQGLLGYAPNSSAAAASSNSQNYSSGNQRPVLLPDLTHRQDGDKTGQDCSSNDDKPSHPQKGGYDHNFAVPVHLQNFALMSAPQAAGSQSEKKLSDHHHQQQPQVSRGQGVRIDLASSQPFVMPFGSIGPPGSAPTGLDFSALAQNHAMFQSQEAARHGYPQLNFAAQSMQATQHKAQHQITGETKSVAADSSSTPAAGDNERKKSASTKYHGDSQQHSLSFSRTENKSYVPPFLSGNTNDGSSRTLSLIGAESQNAFGIGSKSASSSAPASTQTAASSTFTQQQQQQQQQHFLQLHPKHQQQLIQQHHLNRPRSAAPSTPGSAGGYPDRLSMTNLQSMMYPSSAAQAGVQSPQMKASSARVTLSSAAASPSNLIVMKNNNHHQQQAKASMQGLSTPTHQTQSSLNMSSSKMGPSVTNLSTGGDLSRSSNAPVASGSPSNSVSKSTGGSPPATGSAKGVQQPGQLSSPQQQSAKNPASSSGSKSTPSNHYGMPMPSILGQQPNLSPASNPGSKQETHIPPSSLKQPSFPQGHFFISNTYAPQAPGAGAASLGLYQKRTADKTQPQVPHQQNAMSAAASNNMKTHHPPSGGFMHLAAAAAQSAGGMPHSHMPGAQLTFGSMQMPVKPSSDQKPAAGK